MLVDLEGKGRRIRTLAMAVRVKKGIDAWQEAAGIDRGLLLRSIAKGGKVGESLSDWAIWSIVEQAAKQIGIERLGAAYSKGTMCQTLPEGSGDLEQIKFLLGHSSKSTVESYLRYEQEVAVP